MSAIPASLLAPEQVTVTSGVNPGVTVTLRNEGLFFPELDDLTDPNPVYENRVAPGLSGRTALAGIEDELRATLPFWLTGHWDIEADAAPTESPRVTLRRNWVYINHHLILPSDDAALAASYQSADVDEDPISFSIQFLQPVVTRYPGEWVGTIPVILPGGALIPAAAVGS